MGVGAVFMVNYIFSQVSETVGETLKDEKGNLLVFEVAVTGDVNGDGKINVADFMSIKGYILKKNTIAGVVSK